jgi:hypothetical protein
MTDQDTDRTLDKPGKPREVDDEVLTDMTRGLTAVADSDTDEVERGDRQDAPFNLGMPAPRAIDLRKLWRLAGKQADPMIVAALGPKVPVLLSHGVTALPRPGRKPARVWGLGYKVEMFDVASTTVDVQPGTDLLEIAKVGTEATVDLGLDGSLEIPEGARVALASIPGVNLTAARVAAGAKENAKLSISFTVSVPRIISGLGDGYGGAEWNLYAQDKRLEGYQALLQTILLPKGVKQIRIGVTGWAREAGLFGPKEWVFETATFVVDLDG